MEGDSTSALGSGDVVLTGGTLVNAASGTLNIGGKYTQSGAGTLQLNLGSSGEGLLTVSNSATFSGKLCLKFLNNYVPTVGSAITIITCGKLSGQFTSVTSEGLASGYTVSISYSTDSVKLTLTNS